MFTISDSIEDGAGLLVEADLAAVLDLPADLDGPGLVGVPEGHVGDVDRGFLLDGAARLLATGLDVALDQVDLLDDDAILVADHPQHLAGLALVLAGGHHDQVIPLDLVLAHKFAPAEID